MTREAPADGSRRSARRGWWASVFRIALTAPGAPAIIIPRSLRRWLEQWLPLTVNAGHLMRAARMPPRRLRRVCLKHGIRTVVSFDRSKELADEEARAVSEVGVEHLHLPSGQVPTGDTLARFLEVMDDASRHPVLMHCRHGIGRTGLFTALYRIEYLGWTNEAAVSCERLLRAFGPGSRKAQFLLKYVPRSKRPV